MKNTNYKSITSLALACAAAKVPETMPEASEFPEQFRRSIVLYYMLMVITKAVNGDWQPTMEDTTERKYFPWYWIEKQASGRGLSFVGVDFAYSLSCVGPRLACETEEQAEFVGKTFIDIYEEYLMKA